MMTDDELEEIRFFFLDPWNHDVDPFIVAKKLFTEVQRLRSGLTIIRESNWGGDDCAVSAQSILDGEEP